MTDLLKQITDVVGSAGILSGKALEGRSAGIWHSESLKALALVRPETTEQVSRVLKLCHEAGQIVIAAGGMTGLAGGHESTENDIVLSLERMNQIESVDSNSRTMTVEAGVILQTAQEKATEAGLMFALDLGARASCTIGGNISTNAGGVRVLRYGMMRDLVLGLEAVLMDGTVVSSMFSMLKNNTGYDLKQLFIGAEGTLGIVTRAVLRLHEAPLAVETAILAVPDWPSVMKLLRYFDQELSGSLVAFEVMWQNHYELNTSDYSAIDPPLQTRTAYYILMDVFVTDPHQGRDRIEALLMQTIEQGDVSDGALAYSETERDRFWQIRENFEPEQKKFGLIYGYDVSLSIEDMEAYVERVSRDLKQKFSDAEIFAYGHIGDGNLHFSIAPGASRDFDAVNDIVYKPLIALNGSVSAEHGIGLEKKPYLSYTRSDVEIELMRQIKKTLDPLNLLNPGKLFDMN